MYTTINFRTKKELKDAVKAGRKIRVYQAGGLYPAQCDGTVTLEGPHYPEPHRWYATAKVKDCVIISVK